MMSNDDSDNNDNNDNIDTDDDIGRELGKRIHEHKEKAGERILKLHEFTNAKLRALALLADAKSAQVVREAEAKILDLQLSIEYVRAKATSDRNEIQRAARQEKTVLEKDARKVLAVLKARAEEETLRLMGMGLGGESNTVSDGSILSGENISKTRSVKLHDKNGCGKVEVKKEISISRTNNLSHAAFNEKEKHHPFVLNGKTVSRKRKQHVTEGRVAARTGEVECPSRRGGKVTIVDFFGEGGAKSSRSCDTGRGRISNGNCRDSATPHSIMTTAPVTLAPVPAPISLSPQRHQQEQHIRNKPPPASSSSTSVGRTGTSNTDGGKSNGNGDAGVSSSHRQYKRRRGVVHTAHHHHTRQ